MWTKIFSFIFYFIYLVGAELPLFGILLIREISHNNSKSINLIGILLLISIIVNIYFFIAFTKNIKKNIKNEKIVVK